MTRDPEIDPSGVLLPPGQYPRVKRSRAPGEPDTPPPVKLRPWERVPWRKIAPYAGVAVFAAAIAWLVHPDGGATAKKAAAADRKKLEGEVKALQADLATTRETLTREQATTEELRKEKAALEPKAGEAEALQKKLASVVGGSGEVTTADGAVRLELVDKILFRTGEADLTPGGKKVLAQVGAALREIDDKQIWVQGHTDDQPIIVPKVKPAPKGNKPKPPPPLRFASNWELSAARALTVVHYLQDEAKIDPKRLAAVAFSEYRPASRSNRAKNRRIEIVLYPRLKVSPR